MRWDDARSTGFCRPSSVIQSLVQAGLRAGPHLDVVESGVRQPATQLAPDYLERRTAGVCRRDSDDSVPPCDGHLAEDAKVSHGQLREFRVGYGFGGWRGPARRCCCGHQVAPDGRAGNALELGQQTRQACRGVRLSSSLLQRPTTPDSPAWRRKERRRAPRRTRARVSLGRTPTPAAASRVSTSESAEQLPPTNGRRRYGPAAACHPLVRELGAVTQADHPLGGVVAVVGQSLSRPCPRWRPAPGPEMPVADPAAAARRHAEHEQPRACAKRSRCRRSRRSAHVAGTAAGARRNA